MRLFYIALVGLLSLALLGCSSDGQTTTESQQVISDVGVVQVDRGASDAADSEVDAADSEGDAAAGEGDAGEGDAADSEGDAGEGDAADSEGDAADSEGDAADSEGDAAVEPVDTETEVEEQIVEPAEESASSAATEDSAAGDGLFPTVVGAMASTSDGTSWRVDVTLSSEYDSPQRYADAWRVLDASDAELGIRVLGHDHANEQPFTRSTSVDIPADVDVVYIEGRDQVNGWSGERFELVLSR